jgi:electron transport complex protein RnfG
MLNYIKQGWLVLVLGLAFGGALAGVQVWLGPKITENQLNETFGQLPALVPGADGEVSKQLYKDAQAADTPNKVQAEGIIVYEAYDADKQIVGYAVRGSGQGYGDVIVALVGLNRDATDITGIYVLDQKETPNLGSKIADPKWNGQFDGKSTLSPLQVVKSKSEKPADIQAISGATISSNALTNIVNDTVAKFRKALTAAEAKEAANGE